ncbi:hypothetical protein MD484_g4447, partial [Candolleomyces efflorescens]
MSSSASSTSTTSPNLDVLFARGVLARLSTWPALRVAIQESWGSSGASGADKKSLLASEILDAFQSPNSSSSSSNTNATSNSNSKSAAGGTSTTATPPIDDIYIEDLLIQIMEDEFDVSIEDGSAESVSRDILRVYEEVYHTHSDLLVRKFEEAAERSGKGRVEVSVQRENPDDDEDEDGEEGEWEDDEDGDGEGEGDVQMDEVPQLVDRGRRREEPEVDEDGFTVVKGRGKRR